MEEPYSLHGWMASKCNREETCSFAGFGERVKNVSEGPVYLDNKFTKFIA